MTLQEAAKTAVEEDEKSNSQVRERDDRKKYVARPQQQFKREPFNLSGTNNLFPRQNSWSNNTTVKVSCGKCGGKNHSDAQSIASI